MNGLTMDLESRIFNLNKVLKGLEAPFTAIYRKVAKNNEELDGIMLKSKGASIAPTFYPTDETLMKDDYDLAKYLIELYQNNAKDYDLTDFLSKDNILNNIKPRLWSNSNAEHLIRDNIAMRTYEDMVITFFVIIDGFSDEGGTASMQLSNDVLNSLDITLDEAYSAAVKNVQKDARIIPMVQILAEMMGVDNTDMIPEFPSDNSMWVVTNMNKLQGAGCILNTDVLNQLAEKMQVDSFYILPSSIHEIIAIPASFTDDVSILSDMVKEVNGTQVAPQERLTDSVYIYKEGEFSKIA